MKCYDPILVYTNSSGSRQFRNFSLADRIFKTQHQQVLNCGKCLFCRKRKSYELACRCVLHASLYKENCFLTLTYDEKRKGYHNVFQYSDIQKFKKRLRSHCSRIYGKRIEVFNVHEYGRNGKKHWHLIVFNHNFDDRTLHTTSQNIPLFTSKTLSKLWGFGFVTIGDVSAASAMYQSQYVEKDFKNGYVTNSKKSHSKHAGIGKPYFLKHYKQILTLGYVPVNGRKLPIPRYFIKLAHKHYSHFYQYENFFDTKTRKALYKPFKSDQANRSIADLYVHYSQQKEHKIIELSQEWDQFIQDHLTNNTEPDFIKSKQNAHHDLNKFNKKQNF